MRIKHRFTNTILWEGEAKSTKEAVKLALASGANLRGANLADAILTDADLAGANLADAILADAILAGADLAGAILTGANLEDANLNGANLAGAILNGADLCGANLTGADLYGADLAGAILADADLTDAILRGAILADAILTGAKNSELAIAMTRILPEGDLIGWKKVSTPDGKAIVKLLIPADAKRSHARGRKCRAEFAMVLEAPEGAYTAAHGPLTRYIPGETVKPDKWDEDWTKECSNGIHFFITRAEAEAY